MPLARRVVRPDLHSTTTPQGREGGPAETNGSASGAEATRLQGAGFGRGSSAGRTVAHPEPQIGAESAELRAICLERGLILGRTPGGPREDGAQKEAKEPKLHFPRNPTLHAAAPQNRRASRFVTC